MTLLALLACTSTPPPSVAPPPTWVDDLAGDPAAFEALMSADGREAWIDLHAGRADTAFPKMKTPAGRARAAAEVAPLYAALGALHRAAATDLAAEWTDAPEAVRAVAAYAANCSVRPEMPELAARHDDREWLHLRNAPVLVIQEGDFERRIHDPCEEAAVAAQWSAAATPIDGLAATLFGPIAFDADPPRTPQGAREALTALRRQLELSKASRADDEGLTEGLDADEVAFVQTVVALATPALERGDTEFARTLLTHAHPAGSPGIGPRRPPVLYALLARAEYASGDPRRALDWLGVLGQRGAGVRETVADVAVLRGLSRVGDSKEE